METKLNHTKLSFNKIMLIFIIILASISVIGLVIGGVWDLQISKVIAGDDRNYFINNKEKDTFQWYFSGLQGIIATFICAFVIANIIVLVPTWRKWNKVGKIVYWIGASLFGFLLVWWQSYDGFMNTSIYEGFNVKHTSPAPGGLDTNSLWQGAIVATVLLVGFVLLAHFVIAKQALANAIAKWSLFAFLAMLLAFAVVAIMKTQIHRERYFQLMITGHEENFKPWYSLLWDMNRTNDGSFTTGQMTSFPSGHTTWAMEVILFIPLIYFVNKNKLAIGLGSFVCIAFVICTMFCRIATGSHYLSDVSGAVIINLACFLVVGCLLYKSEIFLKRN